MATARRPATDPGNRSGRGPDGSATGPVSLSEQQREAVSNVGGRLRLRREEAGLSLRQFARSLGVSASFLSQLENGKSRPSVATLYLICNALEMSIDELFTPDEPAAPAGQGTPAPPPAAKPNRRPAAANGTAPTVDRTAPGTTPPPATPTWDPRSGSPARGPHSPLMRPADRPVLVLDSGVIWESLTSMHEPAVDFMLVRYEVGGSSTPDGRFIRHMGSEYGYVISGTLEVTLGFEKYYLTRGDAISFDSSTPHRLTTVGDEPVEAIWFVHGRNATHDH